MGKYVDVKNNKGEVVKQLVRLKPSEINFTIYLTIACLQLMFFTILILLNKDFDWFFKLTTWIMLSCICATLTLVNLKRTLYAKDLVFNMLKYSTMIGIVGPLVGELVFGIGEPMVYSSLIIHTSCYITLLYSYLTMKPVK